MNTQPTSVEQLIEHEKKTRSIEQQEDALKRERNAERKLAYLKSSRSEKAIFRYFVMCVVSFLLELGLVELVKADEFNLMATVCIILQVLLLWWFGNGKAKTAIGEGIQLVVKWIGYAINGAALLYLIFA